MATYMNAFSGGAVGAQPGVASAPSHELSLEVASLRSEVKALRAAAGASGRGAAPASASEVAALRAEVSALRKETGTSSVATPAGSQPAAADSAGVASAPADAPACTVPAVVAPVDGRVTEPSPVPSIAARSGTKVAEKRGDCTLIWNKWPLPPPPAERWPTSPELAACEEMWRLAKVHYQCTGQPGVPASRSDWSMVRCCPPLPYDVDTESPEMPAAARGLTTEQSWADVQKYGYPRRALLAMLEPVCHEPTMTGWREEDEVRMGNCAMDAGVAHLLARVDAAKVSPRVVYVDLGSRDYPGVAKKLNRMPHAEAFTEQVLFELDAKFYDGYTNLPPNVKFYKGGAYVRDGYLEFRAISMASLDENAPLKPLDDNGPPAGHVRVFDLARVLMQELDLTPKDFVVIKMDIECTEYIMLKHLVDTGAADLIDEIFVETHWGTACKGAVKSRGDAEAMYKYARDGGLYVHDDGQPYLWPGVPFNSGNVVHM